MLLYILMSRGNQIPLQQVSALGGTIAYTLSAVALLIICYKKDGTISRLSLLSIASCLILFSSFVWAVVTHGPTMLLLTFLTLLILGSYMFYQKSRDNPLEVFEEI